MRIHAQYGDVIEGGRKLFTSNPTFEELNSFPGELLGHDYPCKIVYLGTTVLANGFSPLPNEAVVDFLPKYCSLAFDVETFAEANNRRAIKQLCIQHKQVVVHKGHIQRTDGIASMLDIDEMIINLSTLRLRRPPAVLIS